MVFGRRGSPLPVLAAGSTLALLWLIHPLGKPILWAVVLAVLLKPAERRVRLMLGDRPSISALAMIGLLASAVIVPGLLLANSLTHELTLLYGRFAAADPSFRRQWAIILSRLPHWAAAALTHLGLHDGDDLGAWLETNIAAAARGLTMTAIGVGQRLLGVLVSVGIASYLLFFLLRDGDRLAAALMRRSPLDAGIQQALLARFLAVTRATVASTLIVSAVQGTLGGLLFWLIGIQAALLWGALMAAASLVPTIGTGFVWIPVGLYMLLTDRFWQGSVVLLTGLLVISTIDNLLRPTLVGRSAGIPEWLVFIAIFGGIALFGLSGVIAGPIIIAFFLASWEQFPDQRTPAP